MRIDDALKWATETLQSGESPTIDARALLCHVLQQPASYLFTWPERSLSPSQKQAFEHAVTRRQSGEPVAYITGFRAFWTLTLKTRQSTLIPRPETELLVEKALGFGASRSGDVLDLGTGTGAIALALASERPGWQVTGVDRIDDAIALATENAASNDVSNVSFVHSHWFSNISTQFFLIVSNPPYVEPDSKYLSQGDVRFEPKSALTADEHGLSDIRSIVSQARAHLLPGGYLLIEHGHNQGQAVRDIFLHAGFTQVETFTDLNQQERVTAGVWKAC